MKRKLRIGDWVHHYGIKGSIIKVLKDRVDIITSTSAVYRIKKTEVEHNQ